MKLARTDQRDVDSAAASATRTAVVRRARGMLAGVQPQRRLSDELIAERRTESRQAPITQRAKR